jgi:hypothetical protein
MGKIEVRSSTKGKGKAIPLLLVLISVRTINKIRAKKRSTLLEGDMILSEHTAYILAHK